MAATATRRTEGLIVRRVGAETVVFDTRTEQVTCLDEVTARVWDVLDGGRARRLGRVVERRHGRHGDRLAGLE